MCSYALLKCSKFNLVLLFIYVTVLLFFKVRDFGITESKNEYDTSSSDDETRISTMEINTTEDDVTLRGKMHQFHLPNKYSKFLARESQRDHRIEPECTRCFPVSGKTTNLFAFEFLQNDRIDSIHDQELFKNEQGLATFLQNIHKTHAVSIENGQVHGYGSAITWDERLVLASSMNPGLKEVCQPNCNNKYSLDCITPRYICTNMTKTDRHTRSRRKKYSNGITTKNETLTKQLIKK